MENVGLRELKIHLSQYVAKARAGKKIVITDRGKEVAELTPLSPERKAAMKLAKHGKLKWSGGKPWGLSGVSVRGKPFSETVLEDRT